MNKTTSTKPRATKPKPKGVKNDTKVSGEQSAKHKPGTPPPHSGRPVKGCACWLCTTHRRMNQIANIEAALAAAYDDMVVVPGTMTVLVGKNATAALRRALGAK